ncbi:MAG: acyltransferase family protein [Spirochaetaceae bacterium]|nr:acyltransferase family protein [Spirochaetaceae bacterium]
MHKAKLLSSKKELPLWKVTGQLRGIAILAMVINHAAFFGVLQYRFNHAQISKTYIAPFGIPWESVMPGWIILQELTRFVVPLFILLTGHYVSNFSRKGNSIWEQIKKILFPFLFWSCVGWFYSYVLYSSGWDVKTFLINILYGSTQPGYFFIPLILQYYLISQWIVPWVKKGRDFFLFFR